jgi:lauroyl/myristoyl acyltransferase
MNFQQFATSRFGTRLWIQLGELLPPQAGYALAQTVSASLSRKVNTSLYGSIYGNQAVVLGSGATPGRIHQAVRGVLGHAGHAAYDLMHLVALGEKAIRAGIEFGPNVWADIEAARAGGRGVMMCGAHISNFNLAFVGFALHNIPLQLLTLSSPTGGFRLIADLRSRGLIQDTPIDASALRQAVSRLRQGGMVLTGVDWPIVPWEKQEVTFFGRPARLPTGHIRLAISANARLLPVACRWDPRRGYYVQTAPPMEIESIGDRVADLRHNAHRVLKVFEGWIHEHPEQWLMYYPVWDSAVAWRVNRPIRHDSQD